MTALLVRDATYLDLDAVVQVHLESFPEFFLSTLGPRFLRQFYGGLLQDQDGVLLVAEDQGTLVGFVGGASEQVGFYGRLLRTRKWRFAWAALPSVLRRPSIAARVSRGRGRADDAQSTAGACLMTLGVLPGASGAGIGQGLVSAFERSARQRGAHEYTLTTDADENERVNRFYERLGLTMRQVIVTPEGRRLNEYAKALGPTAEGTK